MKQDLQKQIAEVYRHGYELYYYDLPGRREVFTQYYLKDDTIDPYCVYYVGTEGFDWSKVKGMIPGYIVDRKNTARVNALEKLHSTIEMVMAMRGEGYFTLSKPLLVVAVGELFGKFSARNVLMKELEQGSICGKFIRIDSITKNDHCMLD